jgi:hypothetical protein
MPICQWAGSKNFSAENDNNTDIIDLHLTFAGMVELLLYFVCQGKRSNRKRGAVRAPLFSVEGKGP